MKINPVAVLPANGVETGIELRINCPINFRNANRCGENCIDSVLEIITKLMVQIDVVNIAQCMHTFIGTTCTKGFDRLAKNGAECSIKRKLHRRRVALKLGAMKGSAIIGNFQKITRQDRDLN